jgi:hypothetical protein
VFFGPGTDNKDTFDRLVFACDRTGSSEIAEMCSTWLLVIANYYNAASGKREMCTNAKQKESEAKRLNGQLAEACINHKQKQERRNIGAVALQYR